ncbi:MAG: hypothetical protein AAFQ82_16015, partial [Myxococcota bacterium]
YAVVGFWSFSVVLLILSISPGHAVEVYRELTPRVMNRLSGVAAVLVVLYGLVRARHRRLQSDWVATCVLIGTLAGTTGVAPTLLEHTFLCLPPVSPYRVWNWGVAAIVGVVILGVGALTRRRSTLPMGRSGRV